MPTKAAADDRRKFRPPEVAKRYGVNAEKIHAWIRSGELRAINIATSRTSRPVFLIDESDVIAFEQSREVVPPPPAPRRRRKADSATKKYF